MLPLQCQQRNVRALRAYLRIPGLTKVTKEQAAQRLVCAHHAERDGATVSPYQLQHFAVQASSVAVMTLGALVGSKMRSTSRKETLLIGRSHAAPRPWGWHNA